jgi:DNA polymerase III psi subunit
MKVQQQLTGEVQDAIDKGVLKRLPLTFLPFVNQQLKQWNYLFPRERQSVEILLLYVAGLTPQQSTELFRNVVQLEDRMGVRQWQFSTAEQTIQNSSQLARSPYFQEWRQAVQAVFDAADQHAQNAAGAAVQVRKRLVLMEIPQPLTLDAAKAWRRWQGIGRPIQLDLSLAGKSNSALELLLNGLPNDKGVQPGGLLSACCGRTQTSPGDTWVVDAGRHLVDAVLRSEQVSASSSVPILLSYDRLDQYRQNFSHEMNTMHKDLGDADAVFDRLRQVEVAQWCPAEVNTDPAVREFLRSLYLTGNGAVIFGNSFAEWASSEAFRRARPSFLSVQFGVRSKMKPFTGVAVFDNPDQINPLPAVDDLPGSSMDAQMLALYVWLAARRYEEYQRSTVCLCIAVSISQAYLVAPPEFSLGNETAPIPLDRLAEALKKWVT